MNKATENKPLPPLNARINSLVWHFSQGNVRDFIAKLEGISHQVLNRIFNIDSRNGEYPGVSSDIIAAVVKGYDGVNAEWLLTGNGTMLKSQLSNHNEERVGGPKELTPGQVLSILARAYESQSKTIETQAAILKSIESKMAQEKTQAIVIEKLNLLGPNLDEALAALDKISMTQNRSIDKALGEFASLSNKIESLRETSKRKG